MQMALLKLAANFPEAGQDFQTHLAAVKGQGLQEPPPSTTMNVHAARTYVKRQVGNLFQGSRG
jgi:hypothetical protein